MRKLYTLFTALIITSSAFAQAPEKMSYQAVVRDGSNVLVASSSVGMQISILQGSSSGTAVYVETQTPTSNANGLVSIEIGSGTLVSGDFSTIDWANGPYFVKTETDPTGGATYTITGTTQLMSVPYALHAENSDSWTVNSDTTHSFKYVSIGTTSPAVNYAGAVPQLSSFTVNSSVAAPITIQRSSGNVCLAVQNSYNSMYYGINTSGNAAIGNNLDLSSDPKFQIRPTGSVLLKPLSTAPSSPSEGEMYYDNILKKLRVWDGTVWQNCW
jgi:hypothetical protein